MRGILSVDQVFESISKSIPQETAAINAGEAAGVFARCGTDACCWCKDDAFIASLNATWAKCSAAEQKRKTPAPMLANDVDGLGLGLVLPYRHSYVADEESL